MVERYMRLTHRRFSFHCARPRVDRCAAFISAESASGFKGATGWRQERFEKDRAGTVAAVWRVVYGEHVRITCEGAGRQRLIAKVERLSPRRSTFLNCDKAVSALRVDATAVRSNLVRVVSSGARTSQF